MHSSYNYIPQTKYVLKPYKTSTLLYHLETLCSTISPPTKLYVFWYINKNNLYVLNTDSSHHAQGYFLSKSKLTQITIKTIYITLPALYLYTTSYKIPTQHTYTLKTWDTHTHNKLTKNQNSNAKTKPTHAFTHPQTNIPYQHTKSKSKPITTPNKHIKKPQINTNRPTIHLKRARPNGLASRKHHNIAKPKDTLSKKNPYNRPKKHQQQHKIQKNTNQYPNPSQTQKTKHPNLTPTPSYKDPKNTCFYPHKHLNYTLHRAHTSPQKRHKNIPITL